MIDPTASACQEGSQQSFVDSSKVGRGRHYLNPSTVALELPLYFENVDDLENEVYANVDDVDVEQGGHFPHIAACPIRQVLV